MNTQMGNNPLLDFSGLPRFAEFKPEYVTPAIDQLLADARAAVVRAEAAATPAEWDAFVAPLDDATEKLGRAWGQVSHLHSVMDSPELREVYNANLPKITIFYAKLGQNEALFAKYKALQASPGYAALSAARKKIVENELRDFRLGGAELPADKKARFMQVQEELAQLSAKFEENLLDATNEFALFIEDAAELAGVPADVLAMMKAAAEADGKTGYKITLHMPSYLPVMMYADHRELRRKMYEAYVTRASEQGPNAGKWDNSANMRRIVQLRAEKARLLGFPHFAALSVQTKMAESTEEVFAFLRDLAARSRPAAHKELAELRAFAAERFGARELEAWDIPYYSEKLRLERYAFSEEDLRPYFPAPQVVGGMFDVVRRLYGLDIHEVKGVDLWHPDARFYEIRDGGGQVRGRFYMDLYARAHKRGGAWMDDCMSRKRDAGGVQVPVAYLTCNFTPPVDGKPALFTHDEVTTLFHEFGHGLHHMLTLVDYVSVAGINGVKWDAVELPSQFMENWCWERQALDVLARHHETGASLPDELFKKMIAARNFQSAMQMVRQLEFSLFDMRLHSDYDPNGPKTILQLLAEVREEVAVLSPPAFNRFANSFGHVFAGGYAAGYYSYKWAEVLSADAFSKFEENGVFDRRTGEEFLHNILEQGGAYEPMELFVRFRGRRPTIDALLRHSGLAA